MFLYNMQWTVREDSPLRYQYILCDFFWYGTEGVLSSLF